MTSELFGFCNQGLSQSVALFQLRIRVNLPSPPFPLPPCPFPPFPFLSLPSPSLLFRSPPRREAAPLKPAEGSGEHCKLSQWGPSQRPGGRTRILLHCMLAKRIWLQHFWFFGQHCNEWQNDLYGIFRVQNGGP